MDDLFARQLMVLHSLLTDYRKGDLSLNALIQRIEGISEVIAIEDWKAMVFPLVLTMEQINGVAMDANRALTETEKNVVADSLLELQMLIDRVVRIQESNLKLP